uniref:Pericentriolar material 1 protein C-terminal domain-containing protein n=1 Tax=Timema douglasi TaxID=61478 RepID=A0A7R8Z3N9_TIMDO|nr:unnamed protein product [Timema douglasi]
MPNLVESSIILTGLSPKLPIVSNGTTNPVANGNITSFLWKSIFSPKFTMNLFPKITSRHVSQYAKLAKMVVDLQDSEVKLQQLLNTLDRVAVDLAKAENELPDYTESHHMQRFAHLLEVLQAQEDMYQNICKNRSMTEMGSNVSPVHTMYGNNRPTSDANTSRSSIEPVIASGRSSHGQEPSGAVLKSSDSARRNELKMKVEESQRKALQDHQVALVALQQKAQDQLKEAKVAQGLLLARAASEGTAARSINNELLSGDAPVDPAHGNIQHLEDRIMSLQQLCDNRNELVSFLGDRDADLVSEHLVLQDKLQDLAFKKQHMDHLVSQFQALNNNNTAPSAKSQLEDKFSEQEESPAKLSRVETASGPMASVYSRLISSKGNIQTKPNNDKSPNLLSSSVEFNATESEDQHVMINLSNSQESHHPIEEPLPEEHRLNELMSSSAPSEDGDGIEGIVDGDVNYDMVQKKVAELNVMKAQLNRLQGLMSAYTEDPLQLNEPTPPMNVGELPEEEEQAVNLRRQKRKAGSRGGSVARSHSSSSKPDNISHACAGEVERSQEIHNKTLKLQEAKARLQQLQDLMSLVTEAHSQGQALPEQYLELLNQETAREQHEAPSRAHRRSVDRHSMSEAVDSREVSTVDMINTMADELRMHTQTINEERDRLINTRPELSNLQASLPYLEKKTNTQMDAQQSREAELQAKRRELVELMRKDQGQPSNVNQDVCSLMSADKSELSGPIPVSGAYSAQGDGTVITCNGTWGGSTMETMDDAGEQDHDLQEQSAGYSSEEGFDDDEEPEHDSAKPWSTLLRMSCPINSNVIDALAHSTTTNRDALSMSLDSGRGPPLGHINVTPPSSSVGGINKQGPQNMWQKESSESFTPRAVWTPSSNHVNQENPGTDELGVSGNSTNNDGNTNIHNALLTNSGSASNIWQQQALQLQQQLEMTTSLCQSMLTEHQQQNQHFLSPYWGGGPPLMYPPGATPDIYYQQLLVTSQMQHQHMLMTTLNQCCHLLWLQQRELASLRASVHALQDKAVRSREVPPTPGGIGHPGEAIIITSNENSAHPSPHQSQSNLGSTHQQFHPTNCNPALHPNLKMSYSGGLYMSPADGAAGVTSAQSLPNLAHTTTPDTHVSNNGPQSFVPPTTIQNFDPNFHCLPTIMMPNFPPPANLNVSSRPQLPVSSLIQPTPWLQQSAGLGGHAAPTALNNQVPPGNRANNYWDNFRSYSRQNLLSTSTKSNEGGMSHSPSPLVDRSHNSLRGPGTSSASHGAPSSVLASGPGPMYVQPDQGWPGTLHNSARKEKLNTEQYQGEGYLLHVPSQGSAQPSEASSIQYQLSMTEGPSDNLRPFLNNNCVLPPGPQHPSAGGNLMSYHDHNIKPIDAVKKKRNSKTPVVSEHIQHQPHSALNQVESLPELNRQKTGNTLFEVLHQPVYQEVAALISINESHPQFLLQLFRDLQMVSSDALRHSTLQSIHEMVNQHRVSDAENQLSQENVSTLAPKVQSVVETAGYPDEGNKAGKAHYPLPEIDSGSTQYSECHGFSNMLNGRDSASCTNSLEENEEGAMALPTTHLSPQLLPRNAAWNIKDELATTTDQLYPAVKLDWEAQTVLADLRPFLKAHMDDTCSPAFLEAIRRLTMQLVPHQGQPTFYFEGQLDPLLEDALLKFQGCRLSDVNDELLSVIAEVLQSELIFLRHINHTNENDDDTNKIPGLMLEPQEPTNSSGQQHTKAPTQLFLGTESNTQIYHSPVEGAIGPEAYNGDLAEADQSRHEETEPCLLSGFILEEAQQVVAEEGEESHVATLEEKPVVSTTGEQLKTEGEEWEQEQGLDRVPTRLNTEEEAEKTSLPTSTNTRKGSVESNEIEDGE